MVSVLVVEDNEVLCHTISDALSDAGYEVREARNGDQAIRLTEEEAPHIVVTDLFMPDRDGLELITHLRRVAPSVCIIAMSGQFSFTAVDYLGMARSLGAMRTLRKPFRIAELLNAIAACSPEKPRDLSRPPS